MHSSTSSTGLGSARRVKLIGIGSVVIFCFFLSSFFLWTLSLNFLLPICLVKTRMGQISETLSSSREKNTETLAQFTNFCYHAKLQWISYLVKRWTWHFYQSCQQQSPTKKWYYCYRTIGYKDEYQLRPERFTETTQFMQNSITSMTFSRLLRHL